MAEFEYELETKNKKDLMACLSYIAYGDVDEGFKIEDISSGDVELYEQGEKYMAQIEFHNDVSFMDLPNFFDEGAECMYTYCKDMVTETGACPFKFSFHMSERHGIYFHIGDCTFDGRTITYFDNASVDCIEPSDSRAKQNTQTANLSTKKKTSIPKFRIERAENRIPFVAK